ncbi:MAG: hypothetical protein K8S23_16370 [Candidatus Cloacimonetes bacterium]|nr:hypothetical protein [Candidatus Cloacimonadota bacterium]
MFFNEILNNMLKEQSNIVNKMYLHELKLKWDIFQKLADNDDFGNNEKIIESLNIFRKALTNKKYRYNKSTRNGFKEDSVIFSAKYLDDVLNLFIHRHNILLKKGILWDYNQFSTNIKFKPKNLLNIDNYPMLQFGNSAEVLQLSQNIDLQYRNSGKRVFNKYNLTLPLLIFHTALSIGNEFLYDIEQNAKLAKATFEKVKIIVVTESIEKDFQPLKKNSLIDAIFILQKEFKTNKFVELKLDVFNLVENKIVEYIKEKKTDIELCVSKGFME